VLEELKLERRPEQYAYLCPVAEETTDVTDGDHFKDAIAAMRVRVQP